MIKTLTIYPDYGMAPFAWMQEGVASSSLVGELVVSAYDAPTYFPNPLGEHWKEWALEFDWAKPDDIDWNSFHATGLYLSAVTACWAATQHIVVRYSFPCEDTRFLSLSPPEIWFNPVNTKRYLQLPGVARLPHESLDAVEALWQRIASC